MKKYLVFLFTAALTASSFAGTILIDINGSTLNPLSNTDSMLGDVYNNFEVLDTYVASTPVSANNLFDSTGAATAIDFSFSSDIIISGRIPDDAPSPANSFASTATKDGIRSNGGTGVTGTFTFTFSDLDGTGATQYALTLYSNNDTTSGTRFATFNILTGSPTSSADYLTSNPGVTVTYASLTPTVGGEISFSIADINENREAAINAIGLTAIPEPSSLALLGLAMVAGITLLRRRK